MIYNIRAVHIVNKNYEKEKEKKKKTNELNVKQYAEENFDIRYIAEELLHFVHSNEQTV